MRTAQFGRFPPFLLPMPAEAATALAYTLHERGEEMLAVNGALPTVELFAAELARLGGGRVDVAQHTGCTSSASSCSRRLSPAAWWPRPMTTWTSPTEWFAAFMADADEQAGRPRGASAHEAPERSELLRRIRAGWLWFWVDASGERVHLTGANAPSFGVARAGPGVHTAGPARSRLGQQRGRRGLPPDPGPRGAGLPVHRPGEPDVEQDLRRPRLPACRGHGQPRHRPLRSVARSLGSSSRGGDCQERLVTAGPGDVAAASAGSAADPGSVPPGRRSHDWPLVACYAAVAGASQLLWLTYAPVTTAAAEHYGVSVAAIGWLERVPPALRRV